jgi:hypothetical protein
MDESEVEQLYEQLRETEFKRKVAEIDLKNLLGDYKV